MKYKLSVLTASVAFLLAFFPAIFFASGLNALLLGDREVPLEYSVRGASWNVLWILVAAICAAGIAAITSERLASRNARIVRLLRNSLSRSERRLGELTSLDGQVSEREEDNARLANLVRRLLIRSERRLGRITSLAGQVEALTNELAKLEQQKKEAEHVSADLADRVRLVERENEALQQIHNPAGLTFREVEVLRLVAHGKTNSEIADTLSIALNTVSRHISNIFNKIGVQNRTEAANFARDNGLLANQV